MAPKGLFLTVLLYVECVCIEDNVLLWRRRSRSREKQSTSSRKQSGKVLLYIKTNQDIKSGFLIQQDRWRSGFFGDKTLSKERLHELKHALYNKSHTPC